MTSNSSSRPMEAPGFTDRDLLLLERTADAMSAFMGRPVLAEAGTTDEVSWVVFGVALGTDETPEEDEVVWQMGGEGTRTLGNSGGLAPGPEDYYECRLLWVIQATSGDEEGGRYLKLDARGDVTDWSDQLQDLLPFGASLSEEAPWPQEDEDEAGD